MAKHFEFTNNKSDVFVVGHSQLAGFKGIDKDHAFNISMCKGAKIEDCLEECGSRYCNMKNKVKLSIYEQSLDSEKLNNVFVLHIQITCTLDDSDPRTAEFRDGHSSEENSLVQRCYGKSGGA